MEIGALTFDTTINLPTIVAVLLPILAGIVWAIRLEGRVDKGTEDTTKLWKATAEAQIAVGAVEALVALHKEQFHEYQLQAAKDYVTHTVIGEIKREIITELAHLETRVERQIDRLVKEKD